MNYPPTFKQLKYLAALSKHLHFGKAAEACAVSQSTLSAGIQELEALLGVQLVERTKRSVKFTPLGNDIVGRATEILNAVTDLTNIAARTKAPLSGPMRMGIIPTIAPFLLPKIMPALRTAFPDLELSLIEAKSGELCAMLKSGDLDILLYALPYSCAAVCEMPLFNDDFVAIYPSDTNVKAPITPKDLEGETILLLEEGHCLRDHALSACRLPTGQIGKALAGTSLHTIAQMVASGFGMSLLPSMAIESGITAHTDIKMIPFKAPAPHRQIGLVWRESDPRAKDFTKIGDVIKSRV